MSGGKSTSTTTPQLTQEQKDQIAAQTGLLTQTIIPTYTGAVQAATDVYNKAVPGFENAAQNLAGTASQAQQTLGSTGESALRQGVTGMESLFNPDYEANQISAALAPAQAQYMQNLASQKAQFGGTGELGSAREALAGAQTAGATMATQAQTAAQVQKDIAAQRAGVASNLANIGQTGIGQALGAAGQQVTAAGLTQDQLNKYASLIFGTPSSSYNSNFSGTQGSTKTGSQLGISI
jgi:hypothetical protein